MGIIYSTHQQLFGVAGHSFPRLMHLRYYSRTSSTTYLLPVHICLFLAYTHFSLAHTLSNHIYLPGHPARPIHLIYGMFGCRSPFLLKID